MSEHLTEAERIAEADGWDLCDPAALTRAAVEGIAWALIEQTSDTADREPSAETYREAVATAERILSARVREADAALELSILDAWKMLHGEYGDNLVDGAWAYLQLDPAPAPPAPPAPTDLDAVRREALLAAAERLAGSVPRGFEMRHDGTEDPRAAAYVEGIQEAYNQLRAQAHDLAQPPTPAPESAALAPTEGSE